MNLLLGVKNVAYSDPDEKGATTTGQVAEILEEKYDVMQTFYDLNQPKIAALVVQAFVNTLESRLQGQPKTPSIPTSKIDKLFRDYLDSDDWQKTTGKTIAVAAAGHSKRFKRAYMKRPARPAFIDSGLYRRSFRSWLA